MVAPRVRALTKKKATKREEKEKKVVVVKVAPAECSRLNRDMFSLSNRIFFSLLTVSRRLVVQKLDAHANRVVSPSLFSPRKQKKHSHGDDSRDSPRTPPPKDDFDDLLALEKSLLLLLLSRGKVYIVCAFSFGGGGAFSKRVIKVVVKKILFSLFSCVGFRDLIKP